MASLYPEPDITDLDSTFKYVNTVSSGWFALLLPVSLAVLIFTVLMKKGNHPAVALTAAAVPYTLISGFLAYGKYLNVLFPIAGIILAGIGFIWMAITFSENQ
ncbi:MAG TPA: hypothetical protein ENI22_00685 [Candidatus Pacearchaeota archaeon]|nr:hypothetical protein [Candidatus Pacearchaeota archaeon]